MFNHSPTRPQLLIRCHACPQSGIPCFSLQPHDIGRALSDSLLHASQPHRSCGFEAAVSLDYTHRFYDWGLAGCLG
jgi:hypothetical protein